MVWAPQQRRVARAPGGRSARSRRARSADGPCAARRGRLRIVMTLLPIFLNLDGRPGLLVGAGTVALDKINSLLKTGVRLRVVAPEAKAEIRELAADGKLEWVQRGFE